MPAKKDLYSYTRDGSPEGNKYRVVNLRSPKGIDLEFFREAAKGLRPFQYDLTTEDSEGSRTISERAMGVGIAVPNDSSACVRVLELIKELGVKSVRLDLTYSHDFERADELVDGLCQIDVGVLLHLVQPLSEAEKMPGDEALRKWGEFVRTSLDYFAGRMEAVEIGSTVNRAKWTRYSLDGFLAAWEVAYKEVRARGITLVGPNVTDFEPQYNAGLLGMLKRRNILPDIHSNNLFAERTSEPENFDGKILGEKFKRIHSYNLKKKIRLLGCIASRNGISRNWSTSAFWTLPRIWRYSNSVEEQMADYLPRYFTICFSQRAFERIYWGPLISAREGLLDDETGVIPKSSELDVVALHDRILGSPETWRMRPVFDVFKVMNSFLGGSKFDGTRCNKEGLEICEFTKNGETFHIGWTKNGMLARVRDCYSNADLDRLSKVYHQSGEVYEDRPDFLTQSVTIFVWKAGERPTVKSEAGVIPKLVSTPIVDGYRHYDYKTDKWSGVVRARSREEADVLIEKLGPEVISQNKEQASLRKARNAVWKVEDPRDPSRFLVVKKPRRLALNKKITDRNKPSKAQRSWNGTAELMRRDIGTPSAVAFFESTDSSDMMSNWFICNHVEEKFKTREFFNRFSQGEEAVEGLSFDDFSDQLVSFLLKLHGQSCCFRDLSVGNLLVEDYKDGELKFSLIDTARMRCGKRMRRTEKALSLRKRMTDLKRLLLKLNPALQKIVMDKYMGALKGKFGASQKASLKLYKLKTDLKRVKRKIRNKAKSNVE